MTERRFVTVWDDGTEVGLDSSPGLTIIDALGLIEYARLIQQQQVTNPPAPVPKWLCGSSCPSLTKPGVLYACNLPARHYGHHSAGDGMTWNDDPAGDVTITAQ